MQRAALILFALALVAAPAIAVDLGRAQGTLVIDNQKYDMTYAYAVGKHKNQLTNRNDNTLIVLTDKPLADGVNLHDFEASLPEGVNGVMVCLDRDRRVTHVAVQHPTGMFDGGFFEGVENYEFKPSKGDQGFAGTVSSRRIKTNTMTFSYDVQFSAAMR